MAADSPSPSSHLSDATVEMRFQAQMGPLAGADPELAGWMSERGAALELVRVGRRRRIVALGIAVGSGLLGYWLGSSPEH